MGSTNSYALFAAGDRVVYVASRDAFAYAGIVTEVLWNVDQYYYAIDWLDGFNDHTMRAEKWLRKLVPQ